MPTRTIRTVAAAALCAAIAAGACPHANAADDMTKGSDSGRIKFYRNPMGLPDTSPVPKKDSLGMDYIPVYDEEDPGGMTVKLSPGKIQKTGVRSEQVEKRVLNAPVRVPGTIQLGERRVSIVSFRFEGFVEQVENVTTGQHVHKGQPLMKVYSPALASAAAEYLSALNVKADGGLS